MSPVIEADVRLSLDIKGVNIPQQAPNFFEIIPQDREGPKSPLLKQLRVVMLNTAIPRLHRAGRPGVYSFVTSASGVSYLPRDLRCVILFRLQKLIGGFRISEGPLWLSTSASPLPMADRNAITSNGNSFY